MKGGGTHDKKEILSIKNALDLIDEDIDYFNEDMKHENPWDLCNLISNYSAVITQSTTFASEASIQKIPTLLISKAKRGFISELLSRNAPLIQCKSSESLEKCMKSLYNLWKTLDK